MKTSAAARRYARALFSLARETNTLTPVRSELGELAELFAGDRTLRNALHATLADAILANQAVLRFRATYGPKVRSEPKFETSQTAPSFTGLSAFCLAQPSLI